MRCRDHPPSRDGSQATRFCFSSLGVYPLPYIPYPRSVATDPDLALAIASVLPSASVNGLGAPTSCISRLDTLPVRAPVPRFTTVLAHVDAGLGVVVGRYPST